MKKIGIILGIVLLGYALGSCGDSQKKKEQEKAKEVQEQIIGQYNITLLLDLSDRINPGNTSLSQSPDYTRDIEILKKITDFFKEDTKSKGVHRAKGRLRVICSPNPTDPNMNKILSQMNIDFSKLNLDQAKEKKKIYDDMDKTFSENLKGIYQKTIEENEYLGSDIWRFFKNDVKDYCVASEKNYRNILVVLTDGYVYHPDSKQKNGNRYSYILSDMLQTNGLRKRNWRETFDKGDYGLITTREDLQDLEVLVLEVNPSKGHVDDEDVIKAFWEKWLSEMKVKKFAIYNTDLPVHTQSRIEDFFKDNN